MGMGMNVTAQTRQLRALRARVARNRQQASDNHFSEVAKDILKYPSKPNAIPGTTATLAFSKSHWLNLY